MHVHTCTRTLARVYSMHACAHGSVCIHVFRDTALQIQGASCLLRAKCLFCRHRSPQRLDYSPDRMIFQGGKADLIFLRIVCGRVILFHRAVRPQNPFFHAVSGWRPDRFSWQASRVTCGFWGAEWPAHCAAS